MEWTRETLESIDRGMGWRDNGLFLQIGIAQFVNGCGSSMYPWHDRIECSSKFDEWRMRGTTQGKSLGREFAVELWPLEFKANECVGHDLKELVSLVPLVEGGEIYGTSFPLERTETFGNSYAIQGRDIQEGEHDRKYWGWSSIETHTGI